MDADHLKTERVKDTTGAAIWPPAFMLGISFGVEPPELGSADEDVDDSIGGE